MAIIENLPEFMTTTWFIGGDHISISNNWGSTLVITQGRKTAFLRQSFLLRRVLNGR